MRQEIICQKCENEMRRMFPAESPYPGEHVKFVKGTAIFEMICDHCGNPISKDEQVCAFSIWADHGAQQYYDWEGDFIAPILGGRIGEQEN